MAELSELSPMMGQYMEIKQQYTDTIVFFRLGDFYEMFFEDATIASKELDITLTGRDCGNKRRAPMCGVPFHSADSYIARLVAKGYKVAICEQVEDPKQTKDIVKREVVRIITPGTLLDPAALDERKNNYLCCIYKEDAACGVAFADVSTGEMFAVSFEEKGFLFQLYNEIARFSPSEILLNETAGQDRQLLEFLSERFSVSPELLEEQIFDLSQAEARICQHFSLDSVEVLGLKDRPLCIRAGGALLESLHTTQKNALSHITGLNVYTEGQYMDLDYNTRRNLEITETMREKSKAGSLLSVLDQTCTSMGARTLRKWLEQPLIHCVQIQKRLHGVKELFSDTILREELVRMLKGMPDMERLLGRVVYHSANGRDLVSLKTAFEVLPALSKLLQNRTSSLLKEQYQALDPLEDLCRLLSRALVDEPPFSVREGGIIRDGYNEQVDIYRRAMSDGKLWLSELEQKERERTGIKTLKVGYNKVFGYFLEVTKSYLAEVPAEYIRKQTLANCERFITEELKQLEDTILSANERLTALEFILFEDLLKKIEENIARIQQSVRAVSTVDSLLSLATVAVNNNYIMPEVNLSDKIIIKEGRHPVVEQMQKKIMFVPNDTLLDCGVNRLAIITGPNMAGKSTYMRQVALIVLMAQIGSFVPAASAEIGVVDKIFTRVGASDDISSGRSTFMVEMSEVAYIMKNATVNSLLILDEIGRGTSTFDGLSIAWAVIEHAANRKLLGAKTLFATHYHELTALEETMEGVQNYCIAVKKRGEDVIFLRKIIRGGADDSFGIEVARLAGVPDSITKRAKKILEQLESGKEQQPKTSLAVSEESAQTDLFDWSGNEVLEELKMLDFSTITPIEALNKLYEIQQKLQ